MGRLQQAEAGAKGLADYRQDSALDIRQPVYCDETGLSRPATRRGSAQLPNTAGSGQSQNRSDPHTPDSVSLAFPPLPPSLQPEQNGARTNMETPKDFANFGSFMDSDAQQSMAGIIDTNSFNATGFGNFEDVFNAPFQQVG